MGCVICGEPVAPDDRSFDHFVPQALAGWGAPNNGAGLVFLAHQKCNCRRNHAPASRPMIRRGSAAIASAGPRIIAEAIDNLNTAERAHFEILETIRALRAAIIERAIEADRASAVMSTVGHEREGSAAR
ncbi:hypothetical protein [Methylocapsa aurea]|uniref:hypothetical protein n=1 Tax=Methylocapsa aurea TaxID=663610 RepID=UPI003D1889B3